MPALEIDLVLEQPRLLYDGKTSIAPANVRLFSVQVLHLGSQWTSTPTNSRAAMLSFHRVSASTLPTRSS